MKKGQKHREKSKEKISSTMKKDEPKFLTVKNSFRIYCEKDGNFSLLKGDIICVDKFSDKNIWIWKILPYKKIYVYFNQKGQLVYADERVIQFNLSTAQYRVSDPEEWNRLIKCI